MDLQRVLSLVRKACDDYNMIQENDRIAVGISGGKDSLTLLTALSHLRRFYPNKFELFAITVDLGFNNMNLEKVSKLCADLDVPYYIVKTDIAKIVFDDRKETNPCALCAKMRKGALNDELNRLNINKVAYAHHKDDVVTTMMMSLIYEGRIHTFSPVTYLDRTNITVIRPLIYMNESDVIGFVNKYEIPVVKSACPADKHTKREFINELINSINKETPGVKNRMFSAIQSSAFKEWDLSDKSK